jgi:hypothetical protein
MRPYDIWCDRQLNRYEKTFEGHRDTKLHEWDSDPYINLPPLSGQSPLWKGRTNH